MTYFRMRILVFRMTILKWQDFFAKRGEATQHEQPKSYFPNIFS